MRRNLKFLWFFRIIGWNNACPVKCDVYPACPTRKDDCVRVKFEVRKYFTKEGAISTGEYWNDGIEGIKGIDGLNQRNTNTFTLATTVKKI